MASRVGSLGNSSDGMLHVFLTNTRQGPKGASIHLSHNNWSAQVKLCAADLCRLERIIGMALTAVAAHNHDDVEALRERWGGEYVTDAAVAAAIASEPVRVMDDE